MKTHHLSTLLTILALLISMSASAQNAETLYKQGKELYDAKKYQEAFPKLKTAAEKGHKKAQYRLGRCYEKGRGTAKDEKLAFQWYSKGAKQEHGKSLCAVGKCYKDGIGVEKDRKMAFQWFMRAAKQGNAEGQYHAGKALLKGKGTPADKAKAKSWLTKAVKNPKGGADILKKINTDAAAGDEDAIAIKQLIK